MPSPLSYQNWQEVPSLCLCRYPAEVHLRSRKAAGSNSWNFSRKAAHSSSPMSASFTKLALPGSCSLALLPLRPWRPQLLLVLLLLLLLMLKLLLLLMLLVLLMLLMLVLLLLMWLLRQFSPIKLPPALVWNFCWHLSFSPTELRDTESFDTIAKGGGVGDASSA